MPNIPFYWLLDVCKVFEHVVRGTFLLRKEKSKNSMVLALQECCRPWQKEKKNRTTNLQGVYFISLSTDTRRSHWLAKKWSSSTQQIFVCSFSAPLIYHVCLWVALKKKEKRTGNRFVLIHQPQRRLIHLSFLTGFIWRRYAARLWNQMEGGIKRWNLRPKIQCCILLWTVGDKIHQSVRPSVRIPVRSLCWRSKHSYCWQRWGTHWTGNQSVVGLLQKPWHAFRRTVQNRNFKQQKEGNLSTDPVKK